MELTAARANEPHWAVGPRAAGDASKSHVGKKTFIL